MISPQVLACVIAVFEFAFLRRKLAVDENVCPSVHPLLNPACQASLLHEMWEDLKFAIDWRSGDTKPIKPENIGSSSRMGSRCPHQLLLSKAESNVASFEFLGRC